MSPLTLVLWLGTTLGAFFAHHMVMMWGSTKQTKILYYMPIEGSRKPCMFLLKTFYKKIGEKFFLVKKKTRHQTRTTKTTRTAKKTKIRTKRPQTTKHNVRKQGTFGALDYKCHVI